MILCTTKMETGYGVEPPFSDNPGMCLSVRRESCYWTDSELIEMDVFQRSCILMYREGLGLCPTPGRKHEVEIVMSNKPFDQSDPSPSHRRGDITMLLDGASSGVAKAREELLGEVYQELRIIAAKYMQSERINHTLGATALVNESYIKLFRDGQEGVELSFVHRHAFFKAAAVAMRRILIDHARAKLADKRTMPAHRGRISVDLAEASASAEPHDLIALDEALEQLSKEDERAAMVVRLRFFAGRQLGEIADMMELNIRTIKRDWEFARARLQQLLEVLPDAATKERADEHS